MSPRLTRGLTVLGAVLVLGGVDYEIYGKERVIRGGETIYLELAGVDPRSLMQGDYMALQFRLADAIESWREADGRARLRTAPLSLDERGVATLGADGGSLEIAFRVRGGLVWLGTNAYFFAEGTGDRYTGARYGEFRIDPSSGEAVLVGLRDAALNPL
jgi:uncharacterized membrane-anchored protein